MAKKKPIPMTYQELLEKLQQLTPSQLECHVIVELGLSDEFFPAQFRICGPEHDILDENHPVIYAEDA